MEYEKTAREYGLCWSDYELLDAGDGKKLERWGPIITIRPELQADFKPGWTFSHWQELAHWVFEERSSTQGHWLNLKPDSADQWLVSYQNLNFGLKLTQFKHVGLFPEQQANWRFINERLASGQSFLNLFAYTGAASLVARQAGAEVVHVDSVKQMLTWANENQEHSGLSDIKWVLEDAIKFARREVKRGKFYDGIIMDPPAWGRGANGEKWKLENQLSALLQTVHDLLKPGAFLIVNTYSPKITLSDLALAAGRHFSENQVDLKQLWMLTKTGKELFYGNLLRVIK